MLVMELPLACSKVGHYDDKNVAPGLRNVRGELKRSAQTERRAFLRSDLTGDAATGQDVHSVPQV